MWEEECLGLCVDLLGLDLGEEAAAKEAVAATEEDTLLSS
jgi:hypothetical protein